MDKHKIGISDIGVHIPTPRMDLEFLIRERVATDPRLPFIFGEKEEFLPNKGFREGNI